ncbi:MAG: PKD domain-containing protein [Thermoplasmata archaeon]|nr:PKD domain-containing protein [Thermoplasmata archaeon]
MISHWSGHLLVAVATLALLVGSGVPLPGAPNATFTAPLHAAAPTQLGIPPPPPPPPPAPAIVQTEGLAWIDLTHSGPGHAPPASAGSSLAYDAADAEWVEFGGCGVPRCPLNDTWVFRDGGWQNVTRGGPSPPARAGASMDYDANAQGILLFGGLGTSGALNDTWLFRDGLWTNETYLGNAPSSREEADLVFDPEPETNGSLLFGGCQAQLYPFPCFNDTWVWNPGAGWVELSAGAAPPARGGGMMAYDAADGYVVLFGGWYGCGLSICNDNDTWEYYSGQWWPVDPAGPVPSARDSGAMTFDAALGGVLLFGGLNESTLTDTNDSWEFSQGGWSELSTSQSPPGRDSVGLSVDSSDVPPLLFGGNEYPAGTPLNDTWVFEPALGAGISGAPAHAVEAGSTILLEVAVVGGSAPYAVTIDFGDGHDSAAAGPGPMFEFPATYDSVQNCTVRVNVTDSVGVNISATAPVTVMRGPSVQISTATVSGDVGVPAHFTGTPGNGSPLLLNYSWSFGDGTPPETGPIVSHIFSLAGPYAVELGANDAAGTPASTELLFVVAPNPTVTISATPTGPVVGVPLSFIANVSGGTAPFQYTWSFGDGASAGSPGPSHVYATSGTFQVQLWVNDSAGGSAHSVSTLSVAGSSSSGPGPSPGSGSTPIPSDYWIALGAVVGLTLVAAAVLLWKRPPRP